MSYKIDSYIPFETIFKVNRVIINKIEICKYYDQIQKIISDIETLTKSWSF